jgi:tripartite-type tricarboxylate transporter receptor subunit TctC
MLTRRRLLQLGTAAAVMPRGAAHAADFPTKPVTLVCPWPAGGGTDQEMRALAEGTIKHLGQNIVIDNKPGGSGTVGPATVAAAARPDGYTLTQIPITIFRLPHMQKVTWDPFKDFTYVIHVTGYTFGVVVKADSPWKTFQELIAHAKANPGKVTYGTPGAGTTLHITMEAIAAKENIKLIHVPFKGQAESTAALMGGHVMASADSTGWGSLVDAGQLRLLCTWTKTRTKRWPQVPTLVDLGYGIVSNSPYGIAGPKGMDPKVVKTLHDAFRKGMEEPVHLKTLERLDMEPYYLSSEDYTKFVKVQYDEARAQVEQAGLLKKG